MTKPAEEGGAGAHPPAGDERRGQPAHDVFVSYSTRDKPVADAIVSRLEQAGIRCWVAPRDVIPGEVFGEAIIQAIGTSRLMVVVLSGMANQSHHVHREVERAVANDVVVIPFRIESVEPSGAMAYFLASEHWLDAMTPPLDMHIAQLVRIVRPLLGSAQTATSEQDRGAPSPPLPGPKAPRGRPRWLAWSLIAGASTAVIGLTIALLFVFVFSQPAQPKMVPLDKLSTGDCMQTPADYAKDAASRVRFWSTSIPFPHQMPVVPCSTPHSAEVFFAGNNWPVSQKYPGYKTIDQQSSQRCDTEFKKYVGVATSSQSDLNYVFYTPDESAWETQDDRRIACMAFDTTGTEIKGSIKNTGQ